MNRSRDALSELLSALILLGVSIAVAFILVNTLPVFSPPGLRPWLRPTLIAVVPQSGSSYEIYLYNPHSEPIMVLEAWSGGSRMEIGVVIDPRSYASFTVQSSSSSVLLRFDSGAWMEVRLR